MTTTEEDAAYRAGLETDRQYEDHLIHADDYPDDPFA